MAQWKRWSFWQNEKDERWFLGTIKKLKSDKQFWRNENDEILFWHNEKDEDEQSFGAMKKVKGDKW